MSSQPTMYTCPACGETDMKMDPETHHVECGDCESVYPEESLIQWQYTAEPPTPIEPGT